MKQKPICTVLLITYNHAPYIRKSIDSVLSQKTHYNYIIKIFDDASTDGSSDIIREYAKKYPKKIEAHIATTNQGAQTNIWNAYKSVDTKYCCLMETDDYWCDDEKLQLQIDALEQHPECSFAGGNTKTVALDKNNIVTAKSDERYVFDHFFDNKTILTIDDLRKTDVCFYPHNSTRCINMTKVDLDKLKHIENFLFDLEQFFYLLNKGPMYYFYRYFSIYQRTGKGVASKLSNEESLQNFAIKLLEINEDTNFVFWKKIFKFMNAVSSWRIKITEENNNKSQQTSIPPSTSNKKASIYYLFNIRLFHIYQKQHKTKYCVLGLPILKIKNKLNKKYIFILGLPMLQISNKTTTNNKEQIKRIKIFGLTCLKLIKQN